MCMRRRLDTLILVAAKSNWKSYGMEIAMRSDNCLGRVVVREVVEMPLLQPERFVQLGIDPPKGVLL